MKRLSVILGIMVFVVSGLALPAWAAPLAEEQPVFDIQLSPEIPYPGQEVVVTVQVDNYAAVAETLAEVEITLEGITDSTTDEPPSDTLNFDDQGEATFSFYAPTESKIYEIKVKLTYGAAQFEESFSLAVETALPNSLARVFSGLGLFAAVMAIMAVGTEVVIEMFKSMLGLKAKPTAMNALEQLKSEIPGAIAGLGIDASRRKDLENLIEGIKTQIKPVDDITVFANAIRGGDFSKAAELLDQMTKAKDQDALDSLKSQADQALGEGFALLYKKIPSTKSYLVHTETDIREVIKNAKLKDMAALLDKFYPKFKEVGNTIANFSAEISAEWLRSQVNTLIRSGRQEVDSHTNELLRTLEGIGFSESDIALVKDDLARKIDNLENLALDKASVYSTAVKNLLLELEKSRNAIQSPVRNYVRKLRESKRPLWKTILIISGFYCSVVLGYAALLYHKGIIDHFWEESTFWLLIIGGLAAIILTFISPWKKLLFGFVISSIASGFIAHWIASWEKIQDWAGPMIGIGIFLFISVIYFLFIRIVTRRGTDKHTNNFMEMVTAGYYDTLTGSILLKAQDWKGLAT